MFTKNYGLKDSHNDYFIASKVEKKTPLKFLFYKHLNFFASKLLHTKQMTCGKFCLNTHTHVEIDSSFMLGVLIAQYVTIIFGRRLLFLHSVQYMLLPFRIQLQTK
jgi:hypothetical protein